MRYVVTSIVLLASVGIRPMRAEAKPKRSPTATSFVAFHTGRVKHDLMMFHPDYPGLTMAMRRDDAAGSDTASLGFSFVTASRADDPFEVARQRDRLLLFRDAGRQGSSTTLGLALFSAMTMLSAHLPDPLRIVFDGPVHLGPAIFDDGGMGAGIAGTGP